MRVRPGLPMDVRVVVLLIVVGGLAFLVEGVVRWRADGVAADLTLPVVFAAFQLSVAAGVLARLRVSRIIGVLVLAVGMLLHLLIVLGGGPWWARVVSGVLVPTGGYAAVLLNTGPVRDYLRSAR